MVSLSARVMRAPGDVRPGHMMLAPLSTKPMAPLSTCMCGKMKGSGKHKAVHVMKLTATGKKLTRFVWQKPTADIQK